jgi:hypothetical protein
MNDFKIDALMDSIKMQQDIMIESQALIRQAQSMLDENNPRYKKALEKTLHLQEKLIEELQKQKKGEIKG